MASAKTARSRAASLKDNGLNLDDGLTFFKSDKFDARSYVQSRCALNEKDIKHLCSYLLDLKKASAEEMRKSVYANYAAFIRTSKEISDLEGELSSIRNLLSTQAALIHGLAEGVHIDSILSFASENSNENGLIIHENKEQLDMENWLVEFPDLLDVLLAERRVDEALAALDEGERVADEAKQNKTLSPAIMSLQSFIVERRQKLADQLAEAACQPSTRGAELRSAISALKKLGDGPRAHSLLINVHLQRYQFNMQSLHPSSTSYGGAYTAALSQMVFSTIAQATSDSQSIFGKDHAYTSEFVVWATQLTESFALLVKRHALASSAAAGGLRAAAECVQIALGHCSLLEARGLTLCPVLLKLFRPSVEQAVDANLKRIKESTAALAAADDWILTYAPTSTRQSGRPSGMHNTTSYQYKLTSSAHRFNLMVQDFFEDVGSLLSMQLGGKTLEGLFQVFDSYVNLLMKAIPDSMEEEANSESSGHKIVRMADSETQQIALLANASLLADDLLPRAALKLTPLDQANYTDDHGRRSSDRQNRHPEQREWKKRLVSSVDRLKDTFCLHHALYLIFTEDGDSHLTAEMYLNMDGNVDEVEWMPSLIFQELFVKLNRMASLAAEMFVGRERFATLLLMRLTETVILWLSGDQSFWDDIEKGPRPLGRLGLQQFYLDMKFVICFASQRRYLSRNLQRVVSELISKAMAAFAATGVDPDSVLPEDERFNEICQDAMERLSGKPKGLNEGQDHSSPTASISAQSVSSARSHGSS